MVAATTVIAITVVTHMTISMTMATIRSNIMANINKHPYKVLRDTSRLFKKIQILKRATRRSFFQCIINSTSPPQKRAKEDLVADHYGKARARARQPSIRHNTVKNCDFSNTKFN